MNIILALTAFVIRFARRIMKLDSLATFSSSYRATLGSSQRSLPTLLIQSHLLISAVCLQVIHQHGISINHLDSPRLLEALYDLDNYFISLPHAVVRLGFQIFAHWRQGVQENLRSLR